MLQEGVHGKGGCEIAPTSQYRGPYSIIEDYGLEVSIIHKNNQFSLVHFFLLGKCFTPQSSFSFLLSSQLFSFQGLTLALTLQRFLCPMYSINARK